MDGTNYASRITAAYLEHKVPTFPGRFLNFRGVSELQSPALQAVATGKQAGEAHPTMNNQKSAVPSQSKPAFEKTLR